MSDVKLKDIAEYLNISIVAVSNALSGKKGVSASLRGKVIRTAEEFGYDVSKYQDRKKEKEIRFGVILSGDNSGRDNAPEWILYQQVVLELSKRRVSIALKIPDQKHKLCPKMVAEWDRKVDGILVIGQVGRREAEPLFRKLEKPVVLLDFQNTKLPCNSVGPNHYMGVYRAAKYLLERGHEDIAFLYASDLPFIQECCFGFRRGMEEYGKTSIKKQMLEILPLDGKKRDCVIHLPEKMPTAFVCAGFWAAGRLFEKLEQKGYTVPEDVSVIVYDYASIPDTAPPLCRQVTCCSPDIKVMAETAVDILMRRRKYMDMVYETVTVDSRITAGTSVKDCDSPVTG